MKALSVKQPWAHLLIFGLPDGTIKKGETRTWSTPHRGPLLIVASKTEDKDAMDAFGFERNSLPLGKAVGVVEVHDCRPMKPEDSELAFCGCYDGAYIWLCRCAYPVEPFGVKGRLNIYTVNCDDVQYEYAERVAILELNNPMMNKLHVKNKAAKEIRQRFKPLINTNELENNLM